MSDADRIVVLVLLRALPGREAEAAALITAQLTRIREQEPACISISVHRQVEDPARFMLHETWSDAASFDEFVSSRPYMLAYLERLRALLSDREMTSWTVIG